MNSSVQKWVEDALDHIESARSHFESKDHLRKNILISCQQAVEYIVKAYLIQKKTPFKSRHEISYLQECLRPINESFANSLKAVIELDRFSGKNRYPDHNALELTEGLVREYVIKSENIVDLILSGLEKECGKTLRSKKKNLGAVITKVENLSDKFSFNGNYVTLHAFLPKTNTRGSCAIRLEHTAIRGGQITFGSEEIISQLLIGFGSSYQTDQRQFIVGKDDDGYTIQLNQIRATVDEKYVSELCEAIDSFAKVYFQYLLNFEDRLECRFFYLSKEIQDAYRMFRISRELWELMLSYGREFDLDKGSSDWHIFDSRLSAINIYPKGKKHLDFYFRVFTEEASFNGVMLVWDGDVPKKGEGDFWGVETVFRWLQEQFIPRVLYWQYQKRKKYSLFKKTYEKFKSELNVKDNITFDSSAKVLGLSQENNNPSLMEYVEWMQMIFHSESTFCMGRESFKHLIHAIEICLNLLPDAQSDLSYIAGNLGFKGKHNKTEILGFLKTLKSDGALEELINPYRVDYFSRSLFACLNRANYPFEVQEKVRNELAYLETHLRRVELINKYLRKIRL